MDLFDVGDAVALRNTQENYEYMDGCLIPYIGRVLTVETVDGEYIDAGIPKQPWLFASRFILIVADQTLVAQPVHTPAEITKGRFITDKERALIETRIALRKKLHGG